MSMYQSRSLTSTTMSPEIGSPLQRNDNDTSPTSVDDHHSNASDSLQAQESFPLFAIRVNALCQSLFPSPKPKQPSFLNTLTNVLLGVPSYTPLPSAENSLETYYMRGGTYNRVIGITANFPPSPLPPRHPKEQQPTTSCASAARTSIHAISPSISPPSVTWKLSTHPYRSRGS